MKKFARVLCVILSLVLCVGCFALVGCGGEPGSEDGDNDSGNNTIIFSVQELDNVFNPYFSTSGYDSEITGMTQVSVFSSDASGDIYCGNDEPSVALNYNQIIEFQGTKYNVDDPDESKRTPNVPGDPTDYTPEEYNTTYQILLKNGIQFSDGQPLTVKDVIFNLYVLLDPAYYGSATVYSTAIDGLAEYRTQNPNADADTESTLNERYREAAAGQIMKIRQIYHPERAQQNRFREAYDFDYVKENFLEDVEKARLMFYDEIMADWKSAKAELESYEEENRKAEAAGKDSVAYKAAKGFTEAWEIFCYNNGLIGVDTETDDKGNTIISTYKEGENLGYDKEGNKRKVGDKKIDYRDCWKYFHDEDELYLPIILFNNYAGIGDNGNIYKYENDGSGIKEIPNAQLPKCDILTDAQGYAVGSSLKDSNAAEYWNQLYNSEAIRSNLYSIITYWATANKLLEKLMSEASVADDDENAEMVVDRIEGIKIIQLNPGDVFEGKYGPNTITETSYVLQVKIDRVDPKALANFGVTVAPMHYYSDATKANLTGKQKQLFESKDYDNFNYPVYDANGNLLDSVSGIWDKSKDVCPGLAFKNRDYLDKVLKNPDIISVPVGAGMYQVSSVNETDPYYLFQKSGKGDIQTSDLVNGQPVLKNNHSSVRHTFKEFDADNIIYFIRNPFFFTTSGDINGEDHITARDYTRNKITNCKIKNVRYKIITATKLLDSIILGEVHYGDPTANTTNIAKISSNSKLSAIDISNNGYGYIGINATYVPDLEVRKAIMYALDTSSIKAYYGDSASIITRSISTNSWASPVNSKNPAIQKVNQNGDKYTKDYYAYNSNTVALKEQIKKMIADIDIGGKKYNTSVYPYERKLSDNTTHKLEYTFTIAGATDDHPAYSTMQNAANILNDCGFKITVKTDSQALSKLAAGTLTVWAAAWSSGSDPDMYQVYHKDSKATSVNNWGYPTILANKNSDDYKSQYQLIEALSDLIDAGRSTLVKKERAEIYLDALNAIMELAVEYPTYQRSNMYVYRNDIVDKTSLNPEPTAFNGPLARMWEVSLL